MSIPELNKIYQGNALDVLRSWPDEFVQCVVNSPPYWGLRDYKLEPSIWDGDPGCDHEFAETTIPSGGGGGMSSRRDKKAWHERGGHQPGFCVKCGAWKGSFGLEPTPELYVQHTVQIFREVKRVLRPDGILWLNLGDSYANDTKRGGQSGGKNYTSVAGGYRGQREKRGSGLKPKDLCEIPSDVVRALRSDGWYLRSRIPWIKRTAMPESAKDRPTNAIEYVFLLSKSEKYFYDYEAVKMPASQDTHARYSRGRGENHKYSADGDGADYSRTFVKKHNELAGVNPKAKIPSGWDTGTGDHRAMTGRYTKDAGREEQGLRSSTRMGHGPGWRVKQNESFSNAVKDVVEMRHRRNSDWFFDSWQGFFTDDDGGPLAFVVNPYPFKGAHFATFPPRLVEPCIKAGCPKGGIVLDPFAGSGTTCSVAKRMDRQYLGIDLSLTYVEMAEGRILQECGGLF